MYHNYLGGVPGKIIMVHYGRVLLYTCIYIYICIRSNAMCVCICICISGRPPIMYHNYLGGAPGEITMVPSWCCICGFCCICVYLLYTYIKHPSGLAKLNSSNMEDNMATVTILWAQMASSATRSWWLLLPLTRAPGAKYWVASSNLQPRPQSGNHTLQPNLFF